MFIVGTEFDENFLKKITLWVKGVQSRPDTYAVVNGCFKEFLKKTFSYSLDT